MISCYQKFHIHLETHCNSFCSAPWLFQSNMRQKAVNSRCLYSLVKWTSCANSRFVSWGNPQTWQCHAGPSSSYCVCRSYWPDTECRVWPWTMYSSWSIPLAMPKKGAAELTRWIPWAANLGGLHRCHHDRKGQQQTQAGLTLPLLREVVEEPLASSKVYIIPYIHYGITGDPLQMPPACSWANLLVKIRHSPKGQFWQLPTHGGFSTLMSV